ncbi:hypothetical protein HK439_24950 [Labrenzia aggregata]|uniref:DUF3617 family protein n=2 Tax=Roseibium aggregatum TaxID=187304 RepID=A0A926S7D0_9HYPH|nr:hypothetical protein [Roseibium aggregatum]
MRTVAVFCLGVSALAAAVLCAHAAKGDMQVAVQRASPILEGRILDLTFAGFAQGVWTREKSDCDGLTTVDRGRPGAVIAIFRSLMETPEEICQVYGAEKAGTDSQRAAMNCRQWSGAETLGLITISQRGSSEISVQDGERPPVHFRFCRAIIPLLQPLSQQAGR